MVSVLFALLTALFNGLASVLQRMAASTAPAAKALHLSLFGYLIKHKVWLAGIAMVVIASVCQATALATGPVALVQPIFIIELPFTLLSDEGHKVAEAYGAWALKKNYGREYMGIVRSSFLVDDEGRVAHAWPKVKADGHAADVLETYRALRGHA